MRFKVKRGLVPIVIVNAIFLLLILACYIIIKRGPTIRMLLYSITGLYAICLLSLATSRCVIKNGKLYYINGIFFYKIPLDRIKSMQLCKNLYMSLSPDIERIRIIYEVRGRERMRYISVEDNENLMSVIDHKVYDRMKETSK